ncbi:MAG: hypothetical protein ACRDF7_00100 [Candidatus Limnocylindrales bacterium]
MPSLRRVVAIPLLLAAGVLLLLAILQMAVLIDALWRFGVTPGWLMLITKALTYALPGLAIGAATLIAVRRR